MPPYRDSFILILLFFNACNSQNTISTCGKLELSCDDTCISLEHLCDGIKDCKTGLDESHEICKKNECPGHTFRCSTGACIEKSKVCNQIDDCLDASDETPFVCSEKSSPIYEGCGYSDYVKDNGPFPWTIKFYVINDFDGIDEDYTYVKEEWKHYTSGTLVTPNIVITETSTGVRHFYKGIDLTAASAPRDDQTIQIRNIEYIVDPERTPIIFDIIIVKLQSPFVFNTFTYAACLDARPIQLQDSFDIYEGVVATSIDKRLYLKEVSSLCSRLISNVTTPKNPCQTKLSIFEQTITPSIPFSEVHYGMGLFNIVDDRYYLRSVFVRGDRQDIIFTHVHTYLDFIKKTDPPTSYLGSSLWNNKEIKDLDVVSELSKICGKFKDDGVAPYPWHAAIWSERNTSPKRICAGTIIAPKYIVTAASCFWDFKNQRFLDSLLDTYTVSSGFNGETFEQFSNVFHVHTDNYLWESNGQSDVNNLAIVETESDFQFDGLVLPACIDFEEENIENIFATSTAIMISWLVKGASKNYTPGQLRASFLSEEVCREYLNDRCTDCKGEVPGDNSKLCLTNDERGSLTDFGAGLFTQKYKRYYLRGILNRPIIPDDESFFAYYRLFTNIIPFNKVIKTILNTYQPKEDIIFEPSVCSSGYDVPCNKSTCIGYMSVCNSECECDNCDDEDEQMCNLESTPRLVDDCGEFDQDTGDKPWRSGIFVPWHAGILIQSSNDYEIICAASIVSPMYLISAANCFWDTSNNSLSTETFFVGAGYENNNKFLQYRKITNIITKDYLPEYWWNTVSRESHFNNIAIIKLDAALNFDENVKAVCLTPIFQKPQYFPHFDPYNLVSWARGNLYGRNSGHFDVTNSFFNAHCRGMVPNISAPEYMDSNRKKCFYVRDCGPDNDNGNGLSIKIKGRYYLYAISNPKIHTQRGYKCQYYTFTTLGLYFDFIKSNILI